MTTSYRIFGSELSPYSIKVRSYFRYKGLPHEWIVRDNTNQEEFQRYAKLPLIPLVVSSDAEVFQDSTPILEQLEKRHPEPSIHPGDPALAFLSAMLEEYGDEWGNKPMFHYRWFYEPDQKSAAERIARSMMPGLADDGVAGVADMVKGRMVPRLVFVGSSAETKDQIEASFRRQLRLLEAHLAKRPYLFGGRPAFGDFGLYAQLYQCYTDPTPGAVIRKQAPQVEAWLLRMLAPKSDGPFEGWAALEPTLLPFFSEEVSVTFVPWTLANAAAVAAGEKEFSMQLDGRPYSQEAQKYHAKSLAGLRARYAAVADKSALDAILKKAGCLAFLR